LRRALIECVANFSEGRDPKIVDSIAGAVARGPGVAVLHKTMDHDHHRSVITFAGSPSAVAAAALRGIATAVEQIDLNKHSGVHPRLGAADVVPFVPVEGATLDDCVRLAWEVGEELWRTLRLPVYYYEAAARIPQRRLLEQVRKGGFEAVRQEAPNDPERRPDVGGPELHPTAGAVIVGARKFLIAYNVNLRTDDLSVAKSIARSIRTSSGGYPHVKALGLPLQSRGQVQVSMNLTDFEQTPLHVVYEAIRSGAATYGVEVAGSEIIGLIPKAALERAAEAYLRCENFEPGIVLENRVAEVLPSGIDDFFETISDPSRSTGGGSAAALAGAMAAALAALVCRLRQLDSSACIQHRDFFLAGARRDAEAFAALMKTPDPTGDAIRNAIETPLEIAERAHLLHFELAEVIASCPPRFRSDAIAAEALAAAARAGAAATAALNLERVSDPVVRAAFEHRLNRVQSLPPR
jgi:glutamate formiminotransferase